jgi:hypothetical protein
VSKHVWIIEMMDEDWKPSSGGFSSRAEARSRKSPRQRMAPSVRFRVAKYERVGRSEGKEVQGG